MNRTDSLSQALAQDEEATLSRLRDRLADRAGDLVEVAHRTVDSPIGELLLASSSVGLVRVAFASENTDLVLDALAQQISPRVLAAPRRLDPVARELDEYFAGRRYTFEVTIDLQLARGYQREVLEHLRRTAYGQRVSYGELARTTSSPRAVRAVGTACATNPVPIVVPCHRVVRSDGTPGRYRGGEQAKLTLLDLEQRRSADRS
ncbi:methylated-DNA--[protein]-cysteine S-methyltransferase [Propionibacteriaceae bacterium Y1700]|uniref:methylated-DNA--[protein]-cysteine S-methyltransferase n=1 Tax=Microlunatus sp. Y1700 TaxID=3418487 RepID=UPI003DA77410